uniref:hypothetical protein n=1 Tax=Rhizobium sp. TaxID=391 RepID=UPI0034C67F16
IPVATTRGILPLAMTALPKWLPRCAIGINVAGVLRQRIRTSLTVVDVSANARQLSCGWRDGDLLDKSHIGVGTDEGLEAMNCSATLMLDPVALVIKAQM